MSDLQRILDLEVLVPWYEMDPEELDKIVSKWNARYRRPGGEWVFYAHQAYAFEMLERYGCLYAPMSVGAGKSFMSFFLGDAAGAESPLIVTKASIRDQMNELKVELDKHFFVPDVEVWSYSKVSSKKGQAALVAAHTDFIVLDEAHSIKNKKATRTDRLTRYILGNEIPLVSMSATFIGSVVHEAQAIAKLTLGAGNPYPNNWSRTEAWSRLIDPMSPSGEPKPWDWKGIAPLVEWAFGEGAEVNLDNVHEAIRKRLHSTPGVCVYSEQSCDAPIEWTRLRGKFPRIKDAIAGIENTWTLPDGSEVDNILRLSAKKREMSQGGFYRWNFDGLLNDDPDVRYWLHARSAANCALRKLVGSSAEFDPSVRYDSLGLVLDAVRRGDLYCPEYHDWKEVESDQKPERETIWMYDDFLEAAIARAEGFVNNGVPGFLFYQHEMVGDRLEELGVRVYRAKQRPRKDEKFCALSIKAHGTGLDLQQFGYLAFLCPPSGDGLTEQAVGRIHRNGQTRDVVYVDSWEHTRDLKRSVDKAQALSVAHEKNQGMSLKMNFSNYTVKIP